MSTRDALFIPCPFFISFFFHSFLHVFADDGDLEPIEASIALGQCPSIEQYRHRYGMGFCEDADGAET